MGCDGVVLCLARCDQSPAWAAAHRSDVLPAEGRVVGQCIYDRAERRCGHLESLRRERTGALRALPCHCPGGKSERACHFSSSAACGLEETVRQGGDPGREGSVWVRISMEHF